MTHNMNLEKIYPSGAERWVCPVCEREILWQGPPLALKNIVLEKGDSSALHNRFKGASELNISGVKIEISNEEFPVNLRKELDAVLKNLD